jgi:hypothetical protein
MARLRRPGSALRMQQRGRDPAGGRCREAGHAVGGRWEGSAPPATDVTWYYISAMDAMHQARPPRPRAPQRPAGASCRACSCSLAWRRLAGTTVSAPIPACPHE